MNYEKLARDYRLSVDEVRIRHLTLRVALWRSDFLRFAEEVLQIRSKDGQIIPFRINEAQQILHDAAESQLKEVGWVRLAGLKGRRQGFSTYVGGRGYWRATLWRNQRIYILSNDMASTETLFNMVDGMHDLNPFAPKVGRDNAKELEFSTLGSNYRVATAGQKGGGRGSAISFFHGSEAAWWNNAPEHFASSVQAVDEVKGKWGVLWAEPANPLPFEKGVGKVEGWIVAPSEVWLETTSAGPTGEFYTRYMNAMKGVGRYRHVFVPWTVQSEYQTAGEFYPGQDPEEDGGVSEAEYQRLHKLSDARMLWRRDKIVELGSVGKFRQEFPLDIDEAFAAEEQDGVYIRPTIVLNARKREMDDPDAPLIIGVDPAGQGGDRFAMAFRRGNKILKVKYRSKLNHEEAVAWIADVIETERPSRVNIDNGSMGANIVTTLRNMKREYADLVRGVNFGGTSKAKLANKDRAGPVNRRAEMYQEMRQWLEEGGSVPDDPDLSSDLSGPKTKYRPNNDWLLESKTEMKARGLRSPDLADSCALTFATREYFDTWSKPSGHTGFKHGADGYRVEVRDLTQNQEMRRSYGTNSWMA